MIGPGNDKSICPGIQWRVRMAVFINSSSAADRRMTISVRPISGTRQMRQFVKFRIDLYRDSPYAVPPLYMDELTTLDPQKNPAFQFCEARCFMAFDEERPVGRICAMVNHRANETWQTRSGRFGFVDFVDDQDVSTALFTAAEDWVKSKGMESIHGPLGFADLDQEGMLVEGFDRMGTMATIYNYSYYPQHIELFPFGMLHLHAKVQSQWDEFEHVNHKRRRAYVKMLGATQGS